MRAFRRQPAPLVEEKMEHSRNFPVRQKKHASSFGLGPVGQGVSVNATILLFKMLAEGWGWPIETSQETSLCAGECKKV